MNITRIKNNLKNINSKKGISLVLAIALCIVLCLTTATFISIALLQQNDTGSELNTRQAYISTKGSIETAEDLLEENIIKAPASAGKVHYVMYYDLTGDMKVKQFASVDDAKHWIESNKDVYEIIGNTYVTVSNDGSGNCRITAAGSESKYAGTNGESRERKLSKSFKSVEEAKIEETAGSSLKFTVNPPKDAVPPSKGTNFLAVGMQTNYSLLYSYKNNQASVWSLGGQYNLNNDGNSSVPIMILNKQADENYTDNGNVLINSQMPIVFNYCVKNDTDQNRSNFTAFDTGIYFLGMMSEKNSDYANQLQWASFYTNNNAYAAQFNCSYMVINHDMYCRKPTQSKPYGLKMSYAGTKNKGYACLYITNTYGVAFKTYDENCHCINGFRLNPGMYLIPNGKNIFEYSSSYQPTKVSNEDATAAEYNMNKNEVQEVLKLNAHAGYENQTDKTRVISGIAPVCFLKADGKCESTSNKVFGNVTASTAYQGWKDYDIYCAPNWMPEVAGQYHWYCGSKSASTGGLNFLWYSVKDMPINNDIKLNMHSSNIVLSIGPSTEERVGKRNRAGGSGTMMTSINKNDSTSLSDVHTSSNVVKGYKNAEWWLKPYWGESGFTINVKNKFIVWYDSNNDGTPDKHYEVQNGEYTIDGSGDTAAYVTNGINLLSAEGEKFFKEAGGQAEEQSTASDGWVDSSYKIKTGKPADKSSKVVKFTAKSGSLASGYTYKAKSILADFSAMSVLETNNATFQANYIEINANRLQGNNFNIDTHSGQGSGQTYDLIGTSGQIKGNLVYFAKDTELKITGVEDVITIKKGYYLFACDSGSTNILSKSLWTSTSTNIYRFDGTGDSVVPQKVVLKIEQKTQFSGGYY